MNEIYLFKDWTALSQIKNALNPKRKALASICTSDGSVTITIVEGDEILVRVKVESYDSWSLTAEEAEEMLNAYGFNCRFEKSPEVPEGVYEILKSLKMIGADTVTRFVRPKGKVYASVPGKDSIDLETVDGWRYEDWKFLTPGLTYSIVTILEGQDK